MSNFATSTPVVSSAGNTQLLGLNLNNTNNPGGVSQIQGKLNIPSFDQKGLNLGTDLFTNNQIGMKGNIFNNIPNNIVATTSSDLFNMKGLNESQRSSNNKRSNINPLSSNNKYSISEPADSLSQAGSKLSKFAGQPETNTLNLNNLTQKTNTVPSLTLNNYINNQHVSLNGPLTQPQNPISLASPNKETAKKNKSHQKDENIPDVFSILMEKFMAGVGEEIRARDELYKINEYPISSCDKERLRIGNLFSDWKDNRNSLNTSLSILRSNISEDLHNSEIAHHTNNVPSISQLDNNLPTIYFQKLLNSFEEKLSQYRNNVEELTKQISMLDSGTTFSPNHVTDTLKLVNENLVRLASKIYETNNLVKQLKSQFLSYNKVYFKNTDNIFLKNSSRLDLSHGASPFAISEANLQQIGKMQASQIPVANTPTQNNSPLVQSSKSGLNSFISLPQNSPNMVNQFKPQLNLF